MTSVRNARSPWQPRGPVVLTIGDSILLAELRISRKVIGSQAPASSTNREIQGTLVSSLTSLTLFYFYALFPGGSPSRGGEVTVYDSDINRPSLPALFILFLCLFLSLWPFQLYFNS